ncbi:uncharacterized protein LOC5569633 [Aedes aegypti]|uniref:Uncharacterized protein n=1 Tax=Aedes aegypti TaxID=7159 RepID=A0A6I8TER4_AEDAE|nr:ionotropic receptor 106 [Aedes aegypti]
MPICESNNIYQLNIMQLFFDPYSNVVMNRVLKYIAGASCGNKIVFGHTSDKMGSTKGTQYYVVFCHVLSENVVKLMDFVSERQLRHGDGRYVFVTFLNNGSVYNSRFFIRQNDRYRLHYLFMIKFDAYGWHQAGFIHPFSLKERPYIMGQNIEETFKNQLKDVDGYHFTMQYSRPIYASPKETTQYGYLVKTMASKRGGKGSLLSLNHESKYFPDFMLIEDILFDASRFKFVKLLSMNQFRYLCVVTPALDEEVPWLQVFIEPFHWTVWATFLVVIEMLAIFVYRFGYRGNIRRSFWTIHFEIYQTFMNGLLNRRRNQFEEYVIGMFVLLCMILMAVYESALVSSMSMKRFYPEIDTIEEVNNSKYPVVIVKRVTELFNLYFKNMTWIADETSTNRTAVPNIMTDYQHVVPCESVYYYIKWNVKRRLHVVAEYAGSKTNNFAIATFSPYGEVLYYYWTAFLEGDLFKYWQLTRFVPKYFEKTGGYTVNPLNLRDTNIAWFTILVGSLSSILAFSIELICSVVNRFVFVQRGRKTVK